MELVRSADMIPAITAREEKLLGQITYVHHVLKSPKHAE